MSCKNAIEEGDYDVHFDHATHLNLIDFFSFDLSEEDSHILPFLCIFAGIWVNDQTFDQNLAAITKTHEQKGHR